MGGGDAHRFHRLAGGGGQAVELIEKGADAPAELGENGLQTVEGGFEALRRLLERGIVEQPVEPAARRHQMVGQLFQRQRLEPFEQAAGAGEHVVELIGSGGQLGIGARFVDDAGRLVGDEVEIDYQLAGEQTARPQTGAQPPGHQLFQQPAHRFGIPHRTVIGAWRQGYALGLEGDEHRHGEILGDRIPCQGDLLDGAHANAAKLHRRAFVESAHVAVEAQHIEQAQMAGLLQAGFVRGIEGEHLARLRRPARLQRRRPFESDAAGDQGSQGFHVEVHALAPQPEADPRNVPEAAVAFHQAVVRCVDEHLDLHLILLRQQPVTGDLAHPHLAVVDRRAQAQGTQGGGAQGEKRAPGVGKNVRRLVEPAKITLRLAPLPRIHGHIDAAHQSVDAAGPGQPDARPHDPEAGLVGEQGIEPLFHLDLEDHLREIVGETHIFHPAHHHVAIFHLGLARLHAVAGGKPQSDPGAMVDPGAPHHGERDGQGHQRHQPDERKAAAFGHRQRLGHQLFQRRRRFAAHRHS